MRMSFAGRWLAVSCLAWLAACGGGGGGGDGGVRPDASHLSLTSTRLTSTVPQYTGGTVTITGTISPFPSNVDTVYLGFDDSGDTFYAQADLSGDASRFTAVLYTLPWLHPGTHAGTLHVYVCQDSACAAALPGYEATLTYSVVVQSPPGETHRVQPSSAGVAFASTPTASVLSRRLWVIDNFGASAPWTATSDSPWLAVTPSGTSGATALTLTADPSALPVGETSIATVTLSSPGLAGATIRVGLWKDAVDAPAAAVVPGVNAIGLARDPVSPFVYAVDGTSRIQVFNAHTASLVRTISGVGTSLQQVAISPDGTHAYALDSDAVQVVDLATDSVVGTWPVPGGAYFQESMAVVRPNGDDVVLLGGGQALTRTGLVVNTGMIGSLAPTDDGGVVYSSGASSITGWLTSYSDANGQFYATQAVTASSLGGLLQNPGQVAVSSDGGSLYLADYVGGCMRLDPVELSVITGFTPRGNGGTIGISMGESGNVACGYASSGVNGDADIGVFSPTGAGQAFFSTSGVNLGVVRGLLATSGDGLVSVGGVQPLYGYPDSDDLLFVPMGAAPGSNTQSDTARALGHLGVKRRTASASASALRR